MNCASGGCHKIPEKFVLQNKHIKYKAHTHLQTYAIYNIFITLMHRYKNTFVRNRKAYKESRMGATKRIVKKEIQETARK